MHLQLNKEYYCKFSNQILEFVGWFVENKTPYVRNNYVQSFNTSKGKRTWKLAYLEDASQEQINDYKNKLHNTHQIENVCIEITKEGDHPLFVNEDDCFVSEQTLEKLLNLSKKGFIKKY